MEAHLDARQSDIISAPQAREAFVNLMRWQIETDLGYATTHALEIKNATGAPLYHMIFATDHPAGDKIIRSLYSNSAEALPKMAAEARDLRQGKMALFSIAGGSKVPYQHEPPMEPEEFLASLAGDD